VRRDNGPLDHPGSGWMVAPSGFLKLRFSP
jgi:hypothetical protein